MTNTLMLVVAAALVRSDGLMLLQRRPAGKQHAGLWEFPGGKLEDGETPEQALARELREELGIGIDPSHPTPLTFASTATPDRALLLLLYVVHRWTGEPQALEGGEIAWTSLADMAALPMPPADRPFIAALAAVA